MAGVSSSTADISNLKNIKIAVLDEGFLGFDSQTDLLPKCTEVVSGPENKPQPGSHGLRMAQILWAMLGLNDTEVCAPKIYLVQSNGFTNFKAAIDFIVNENIDIVLYSLNWEFGGNFDGQGFINKEVSRATDNGALWINAAGDYKNLIYDDALRTQNSSISKNLIFNQGKDFIEFENLLDQNSLRIVLSWDDFSNDENFATDEDLNIFVYNEQNELIGQGQRKQTGESPDLNNPEDNRSAYAREVVLLNQLKRGKYQIKITAESEIKYSKNIRVSLQSEKFNSLKFLTPSVRGEIMIPGDHPSVITVGDLSPVSARGPTRDQRNKPDILMKNSQVVFSNGESSFGTSQAAALFAGVVTLLKSQDLSLDLNQLKATISSKKTKESDQCLVPLSVDEFKNQFIFNSRQNIRELLYIPESAVLGKIYNPLSGTYNLYVITDQEPQHLPPFHTIQPQSRFATADTHLFLLGVQKSFIAEKNQWQNYGPDYIRFIPKRLSLPLCSQSDTPIWH